MANPSLSSKPSEAQPGPHLHDRSARPSHEPALPSGVSHLRAHLVTSRRSGSLRRQPSHLEWHQLLRTALLCSRNKWLRQRLKQRNDHRGELRLLITATASARPRRPARPQSLQSASVASLRSKSANQCSVMSAGRLMRQWGGAGTLRELIRTVATGTETIGLRP
jgi:hypothetical protein